MFTDAINDLFETHQYINSIGEGTIIPLQKPGKPKGPMSSVRHCSQLLPQGPQTLTKPILNTVYSFLKSHSGESRVEIIKARYNFYIFSKTIKCDNTTNRIYYTTRFVDLKLLQTDACT